MRIAPSISRFKKIRFVRIRWPINAQNLLPLLSISPLIWLHTVPSQAPILIPAHENVPPFPYVPHFEAIPRRSHPDRPDLADALRSLADLSALRPGSSGPDVPSLVAISPTWPPSLVYPSPLWPPYVDMPGARLGILRGISLRQKMTLVNTSNFFLAGFGVSR